MSAAAVDVEQTPDDLLTMPDADRFEMVDGKLVERHMGFRASRIGGELFYHLRDFCREGRLGWVLPADAAYRCFPDDPRKVRKPDVSFIRLDRLPPDQEPEGYAEIAPDLVVEVVSPGDQFKDIAEKVQEYLAAGVRRVWVVEPSTRTIYVHRPGGGGTILGRDDELSGEDVLPGFRCRVADVFVPPGR